MTKEITLKIMSGVVIVGRVARPGEIVTGVPEALAKNLLSRGKAELADQGDDMVTGGDDTVTGGEDSADAANQPDVPSKKRRPRGLSDGL